MNLGQLRTEIQNLSYGTDTASMQTSFINAAYREIHRKNRWPFLEAIDQSLSTVNGTQAYNFPMSNWRNVDAVRISQPTVQNYPPLKYMEPQDLFDSTWNTSGVNTKSTPQYWTMYANELWLYPVPDGVYSVSIYYIAEPPDLVADTDVPLVPIAYHDAIVSGAMMRMTMRERDWIGLELWTQKNQLDVQVLEQEYLLRQRQTSSEVKYSGHWNTYGNWTPAAGQ